MAITVVALGFAEFLNYYRQTFWAGGKLILWNGDGTILIVSGLKRKIS